MASLACSVLLIFAYLSFAHGLARDKPCPTVKPIDNFNFTLYGTGIWHELARYPNVFESTKCGSFEMIPMGDKRKAKLIGSNLPPEDSPYYVETVSEQNPGDPNIGVMIHTVYFGKPRKSAVIRDYVLAIDYDKYFIGYTCSEDMDKKTSNEYVWILSRSKNVEKEVRKAIDEHIKTSNVIEAEKLIWNDLQDPNCFTLN